MWIVFLVVIRMNPSLISITVGAYSPRALVPKGQTWNKLVTFQNMSRKVASKIATNLGCVHTTYFIHDANAHMESNYMFLRTKISVKSLV